MHQKTIDYIWLKPLYVLRRLHLFVFLIVLFGSAQEPVTLHLTEVDGLPDKEFYSVLEDSKGFIWLCADKGLFKYDGKTYKNYSNKEKRGLSVFGVFEDHKGRIWCNNISGQFFYVENEQLHTFVDLRTELKGELSYFLIKDNVLIVFTRFTIYTIDLTTKKIEEHIKSSGFSRPLISSEGAIYLANQDGVGVINDELGFDLLFSSNLPYTTKQNKPIIDGIPVFFQDDSSLFITENRLNKNVFFRVDFNKKQLHTQQGLESLENERIYSIYNTNQQVWFGTANGLYLYRYSNQRFVKQKHILQGKHVSNVIKDKEDNYWITTLNQGVYVIPNLYVYSYPISQKHQNISSIDKIDSTYYLIGTKSGTCLIYDLDNYAEKDIPLLDNSRISALIHNENNKTSYISSDKTIYSYNHETKKLKPGVLKNSSVKRFSILNDNQLLFLNYSTTFLLKDSNIQTILKNKRPYTSFYSESNQVYVSYVDGLVCYDSLWKPTSITHNNEAIYGVSVTESKNNIIWVGTFKDGLFGIKNNEVIYHFTTKNGLVSNKIELIKADENSLWIATDEGIQKLELLFNLPTLKTLKKRDGIPSYNISGIEFYDDQVIFSSNKGLFSVHKTKAFKIQPPISVSISKIEINNVITPNTKSYSLKYDQNNIKIDVNANAFQFSKTGQYKYRLTGLDTHWNITETGVSTIVYNSLPSGNFTFEVKPFLASKDYTGASQSVTFSIAQPFWTTWWFILGCTLVLMGSLVVYFRLKMKKEAQHRALEVKQLSLDNELIALKLENLRSQMNPHFIFNALNSIQEYIVLNQKHLASEYLGKFAQLIRTYLSHSTKGFISLQEELDCLEMYLELEELRFEDQLQTQVICPQIIQSEKLIIPTMLIQPYVENALKHGLLHLKTHRLLTITFSYNSQEQLLYCNIEDNGIGREASEKFKNRSHKPFATKATQDRLALLNYGKEKQIGVQIIDLYTEGKPSGTRVQMSIPYTNY